jgi:hypothetical protein
MYVLPVVKNVQSARIFLVNVLLAKVNMRLPDSMTRGAVHVPTLLAPLMNQPSALTLLLAAPGLSRHSLRTQLKSIGATGT